MMTLEDIWAQLRTGEYVVAVKFVKVGNDYRFTDIWGNHIDLVKDDELELVDGAGTVFLYDGAYRVEDVHSMTIEYKLKSLGMGTSKASMNQANCDFFVANFGKEKD